MNIAIKEAKKALLAGEVPVGCVIVKDDQIIAKGHNKRETKNIVISHAEIETINKANKKLNSWRLNDCDIYITLEPCIMCMGAIIQSRIKNIYFGAYDSKAGAVTSTIDILSNKNINHRPMVYGGVLEGECSLLMKEFFNSKRLR